MQAVPTKEEIVARADAEERKFLEQILLTQCYHLLETRLDYLQRVFVYDREFAHELYFRILQADGMRDIIRFVHTKCEPCNRLVLDLAVKEKLNISKLNTYFLKDDVHYYYATILETDAFELFLEVEEELKKLLHEKLIRLYVIETKAMKIIQHLCANGMLGAVISDCLIMTKETLSGPETSEVLTAITSRHNCTDLFSVEFMRYAPFAHYWHKCELLLRLGAKLSTEQRQELEHTAPNAYQKFFVDDV